MDTHVIKVNNITQAKELMAILLQCGYVVTVETIYRSEYLEKDSTYNISGFSVTYQE